MQSGAAVSYIKTLVECGYCKVMQEKSSEIHEQRLYGQKKKPSSQSTEYCLSPPPSLHRVMVNILNNYARTYKLVREKCHPIKHACIGLCFTSPVEGCKVDPFVRILYGVSLP